MNHVQKGSKKGQGWALMCSRRSLDPWAALNVVVGPIVNAFLASLFTIAPIVIPAMLLPAHDIRRKNRGKEGAGKRSKGEGTGRKRSGKGRTGVMDAERTKFCANENKEPRG